MLPEEGVVDLTHSPGETAGLVGQQRQPELPPWSGVCLAARLHCRHPPPPAAITHPLPSSAAPTLLRCPPPQDTCCTRLSLHTCR